MTDTEKAKAYDEAVAYAKRVLDSLAEDYRCTCMTKDDIINQYSRLFPNEEAFHDDEDSFACRKLIYGLRSLIQQGKETFAGADIEDLIDYLERKKKPVKEPIDGVLYAAACGIKNKGQIEKSEKPNEELEIAITKWFAELDEKYDITVGCDDIESTARHFAQWGAEHAKIDVTEFCKPIDPGIAQCIADHSWEMLGEGEKPVPNDIEEAADEYAEKHGFRVPYDGSDNFYDDVDVKASKEGFIAGAKWDREQMMKEAVEGKVIKTDKHTSVRYKSFYGTDRYFYGIADKQFKPGDKVRVIVLPKED